VQGLSDNPARSLTGRGVFGLIIRMMFIIHPSDKCGFGRKGSQAVRGFFTRAGQSAVFVGGKRCCSKEVMHFGEPGLTHNGAGWAINGRGKLGWWLALPLSR